MSRAPARTPASRPAVPATPVSAVSAVADPMDLVSEVATPVPAANSVERISLSPEVTAESISRLLMSDKPLGFEDMALEAQGNAVTTSVALPEHAPVLAPAAEIDPIAPLTNEAGISLSMSARTLVEQEAGRQAVARRTAESVRNREITARENAKRQGEGSAAQAGDLSYNVAGR